MHLARCPACMEEAESLISLVAGEDRSDEVDLLAAFRADVGSVGG